MSSTVPRDAGHTVVSVWPRCTGGYKWIDPTVPERFRSTMIFAPTYTRPERAVVGRLHLLGLDGERDVAPDDDFRVELRSRLVSAARRRPSVDCRGLALAGC